MLQLPLALQFNKEKTFENYIVGKNQPLIDLLSVLNRLKELGPLLMWGRPGVGRSHLLQAACHHVHQQGHAVAYLPLRQYPALSPAITQGMEKMRLVCWDDIDQISHSIEWETALFHAYNQIIATGKTALCISTTQPIQQQSFTLPDLRSRLMNCLALEVLPLDDKDKRTALQKRAADRGFELSDSVGDYFLNHYPRDMYSLFQLLDQLDQALLTAQTRKLTIPFIKKTLSQ